MQKNANKGTNWLHYIGDLVAANPKMSALIAFELGQLAGRVSLEAAAKYKSLKPKIGEARDYLAAQMPHLSGPASIDSLRLLHAPALQPKKRAPRAGRKKTRKKVKVAHRDAP
jgi:hypothetical protein